MTRLDEHGQPDYFINYRHRIDRAATELIGLARGMIADGIVSESEAQALRVWARHNPDFLLHFPGKELYERLSRVYADGRVEDEERDDLKAFLECLVGESAVSDDPGVGGTTTLPLDDPPPRISHEGSTFVVSGRFLCGCRSFVTHRLGSLGAIIDDDVTKRTDVLLLGTMASRDWKQSSMGRKIEKAVRYRGQGQRLAIIAEDHWASHLLP